MTASKEVLEKYPKTENFEVMDTIGVPHPFCITGKHVVWAADHHCGVLGDEAITRYEKSVNRPTCGIKGCNLKYEEHEQALVVRCKVKDDNLLKAYLQSIKDQCEKDGFAGFVLVLADGTSGGDA